MLRVLLQLRKEGFLKTSLTSLLSSSFLGWAHPSGPWKMGRLHLQACPQQPVGDVSAQVDVHGELKWAARGSDPAGREGARTRPHHLYHSCSLQSSAQDVRNGLHQGAIGFWHLQPDWHLSEKIRTSRSVSTDESGFTQMVRERGDNVVDIPFSTLSGQRLSYGLGTQLFWTGLVWGPTITP